MLEVVILMKNVDIQSLKGLKKGDLKCIFEGYGLKKPVSSQ